MSRLPVFASPFFVGFDDIERTFDRVSKSAADGYPPYNIEKLPKSDDRAERLRITLAVAGFSAAELDLSVEDNELVIRGKQAEDGSRSYLHRGIAARQFQRTFVLADGMEVAGARLEHGLLAIELVRRLPERIVRKIEIQG